MQNIDIKDISISRLSLGTVQLGLTYGVNKKHGKPSAEEAFAILNSALEGGVNCLDTAAAYGDSEVVIGKWLKTIPEEKRPFVVTKIINLNHNSLEELREDVFAKVEASKERLGLKQLPLVMLHHCEDYFGDELNVQQVFRELKERGDICYSGISAYSHHDYGKLAEAGFDAIQIPINLFDWNQIENGGLEKLRKAGMMIFARSIYLQGLIFQDPEQLESHMDFCKETLYKFRGLCEKYALSPAELAISYVLSVPGVTSLVLGCKRVDQVLENVKLMERVKVLTEAQLSEIRECFLDTDAKVLNPGAWNKK